MATPFESYVEGFRARAAQREASLRASADAARAQLPEAARLLRGAFGAARVGTFGSLAHGPFTETSDVDLYVDAIRTGSYWEALSRLAALFGRPVDLVELDHAPGSLLETIREDGIDVP